MGRVAKYKKVKSFDPYSRKNRGGIDLSKVGIWGLGDDGRKKKKRSQKAERLRTAKQQRSEKRGDKTKNKNKFKSFDTDNDGFDAPLSTQDEFDMQDLVGSVKTQHIDRSSLADDSKKNSGAVTAGVATNSNGITPSSSESSSKQSKNTAGVDHEEEEDDELRVAQVLGLEKQAERKLEKQKQIAQGQRREGESKRAYNKRTKMETNQIIKESAMKSSGSKRNLERLQKKKEFLNNKKKNKKHKKGYDAYYNDNNDANNDIDDYNGTNYSNSNNTKTTKAFASYEDDFVPFGEQAKRPPQFQNIPRGATKSTKSHNINVTKLHNSSQHESWTKGNGNDNNKGGTSTTMSEDQVQMEQEAMDVMRRKIQAQYRAIKVKRQQNR